jgi:hypothetical protein
MSGPLSRPALFIESVSHYQTFLFIKFKPKAGITAAIQSLQLHSKHFLTKKPPDCSGGFLNDV